MYFPFATSEEKDDLDDILPIPSEEKEFGNHKAATEETHGEQLALLQGGRKEWRQDELTRPALVSFLKEKRQIIEVNWILVHVQTLGGQGFDVKLDPELNQVNRLKLAIQDRQGTQILHQQIFSLIKTGENNAVNETPLTDTELITTSCSVMLQVNAKQEWDVSSPLISTRQFTLSGDDNSIATKIHPNFDGKIDNCLMTKDVMKKDIHRISFKVIGDTSPVNVMYCGLVRDGTAWNECHAFGMSTDAWFIDTAYGALWGNGKCGHDDAGRINENQIISMEADLDTGTLKFWVDGKRRGPGYARGVSPLNTQQVNERNKALLVKFYTKYDATKIPTIPSLLSGYSVTDIIDAMVAKYSDTPDLTEPPPVPTIPPQPVPQPLTGKFRWAALVAKKCWAFQIVSTPRLE